MLNNHNAQLLARFRRKKQDTQELIAGIEAGDIVRISQAITLAESSRTDHQQEAQILINHCLMQPRRALRIGITGTPGVGKSTFIEAFGQVILDAGLKLAILAVDPSSPMSKGSILGDKTRMPTLAADPRVFIRPSPAGRTLGGVARSSRETIAICEAAGFEVVLVETVGVGQSETLVRNMVDFFLLLLLPNAGDELQGIKRGIMEMADLIFINKAEGEAATKAKIARSQCNNALHLFPAKPSGWTASTLIGSALHAQGIADVWQQIQDFYALTRGNNYLHTLHQAQAQHWLEQSIQQQLFDFFYQQQSVQQQISQAQKAVSDGQLSPFAAAEQLMQAFFADLKK